MYLIDKTMKDILQDIIANKRIEVARQEEAISLQTLVSMGSTRLDLPTRSMRAALATSEAGIIAEFKRKSPSKGWLHPEANVREVLPAYELAGASACSVLTDSLFASKLAQYPDGVGSYEDFIRENWLGGRNCVYAHLLVWSQFYAGCGVWMQAKQGVVPGTPSRGPGELGNDDTTT